MLLIHLTSADLVRPRENPERLPSPLPDASGPQGAYSPIEHGLMPLSLVLGHPAFHSLVPLPPVGQ